jgi:hypothetical protein
MTIAASSILPSAIFHQGPGAVFLVVNWRERTTLQAPPRLLQLSARHERQFRNYLHHGCHEQRIYQQLFGSGRRDGGQAIPGAVAPRRWTHAGTDGIASGALPRPSVGWAISAGLHVAILLALCSVYWVMQQPEEPVAPLRSGLIEVQRESSAVHQSASKVRDLSDRDAVFDAPDPQPSLASTAELIVDPEQESVDDAPPAHVQSPSDLTPAFTAQAMIGAGGGGGIFGSRSQSQRHHAVGIYGGSAGSESAVDAALRWFKRHQSANGRWEVSAYQDLCADTPRCEPDALRSGSIENDLSTDCALSGCALLCYLGAGFDQVGASRYRGVVAKGLQWLISVQPEDGFFGRSNYANAIATMALCEAYALSRDPALRAPAERGIAAILRHQNHGSTSAREAGYGDRMGWDYIGPSDRNDTSVTGWNVMALKSAHLAGLEVGQGLAGAISWLDATWEATNPQWQDVDANQGSSRFPYDFHSQTGAITLSEEPSSMHDMASVGAVTAAFLPHTGSRRELASMARYIVDNQMGATAAQPYYRYYATLALFQLGGPLWKTWNAVMREQLVTSQRRHAGCLDGSWDAQSGEYGRFFATALDCLSLEVYYRYQRLARPQGVRYPDGWHRDP